MAQHLYLATRKGLFTLARRAAGWEIERVDFLGQTVTQVLPDLRDGTLYAVLTLGHFGTKLRRTRDQGRTWDELGVPALPVAEGEDAKTAKSLKEVWCLEAGGRDQPGLLWAGTVPAGLFQSTDGGQSWTLNQACWDLPSRAKWFGGGKDDSGIHSIVVHPRNSRQVTFAVSCGGVWTTEDGGASWECRAKGLRAEYMPPEKAFDPDIQDVHRLAVSPVDPEICWAQHHNGIFHSEDGGREWRELGPVNPSSFGFAVAAHPHDPKTAWFVPGVKDEVRVAPGGEVCVLRTRDGGATFERLTRGLPGPHAYHIVYRHALDVDGTGQRLAFGSTTGSVWTSDDGGESWLRVSCDLPPVYTVRFGA